MLFLIIKLLFVSFHLQRKVGAFVPNHHTSLSGMAYQRESSALPQTPNKLFEFARGGGTNGADEISGTENPFSALSYYLLWSPPMLPKLVISFSMLFALRTVSGGDFAGWFSSSNILYRAAQTISLTLLSSACCGIQLLINALAGAGGCAGFNKYLGPLRPYFFAILLNTIIFSIHEGRQSIPRVAAILSAALLPEIVHFWNFGTRYFLKQRSSVGASLTKGRYVATVQLLVPTMGCVACINKINSSIESSSWENMNILECDSWLSETEKGGKVKVRVSANSEEEMGSLAELLTNAVSKAG